MVHHQNVQGLKVAPLGRQCGTAPGTCRLASWSSMHCSIFPLLLSYCPSFSSLPRRESQSPSSLFFTSRPGHISVRRSTRTFHRHALCCLSHCLFSCVAGLQVQFLLRTNSGPVLSEKTRLRLPWCISCCHGTSARANIRDAVRATRWIDIMEYLGASGYKIEGN